MSNFCQLVKSKDLAKIYQLWNFLVTFLAQKFYYIRVKIMGRFLAEKSIFFVGNWKLIFSGPFQSLSK
mgnify:CR=1 FL=1